MQCPRCNAPAVMAPDLSVSCTASCEQTPAQRGARYDLEAFTRGLGKALADAMPEGVGFALVVSHFGPEGNMAFMSSIDRDDTKKLFRELLANLDAQGVEPPVPS